LLVKSTPQFFNLAILFCSDFSSNLPVTSKIGLLTLTFEHVYLVQVVSPLLLSGLELVHFQGILVVLLLEIISPNMISLCPIYRGVMVVLGSPRIKLAVKGCLLLLLSHLGCLNLKCLNLTTTLVCRLGGTSLIG